MFSFISLNWKGKPLENYESIVKLIAATKTKKGLKVKARLDKVRSLTPSDKWNGLFISYSFFQNQVSIQKGPMDYLQ